MPVKINLGEYPSDIEFFHNFYNSIQNDIISLDDEKAIEAFINSKLKLEPTNATFSYSSNRIDKFYSAYLEFETQEAYVAFKIRWS